MFNKRSLVVFAAAFALVLISGAALAQVGSFPIGSDDGEVTDIFAGDFDQDPEEESPTPPDVGAADDKEPEPEPVKKEEPAEEPSGEKTEDHAEEPGGDKGEDHAEEPAEEKAEEPAEEKAEEKAEEAPAKLGIEILHPSPNAHVDNKVQVFEGWVTPGVGAVVSRGKYKAHTEGDGWRIELVLSPGKNVVTMVVNDEFGREAKDSVTLWYDAPHEEEPKEEEPKEEPKEVAFKANQKYGSCGEEVPYDVFYGNAGPGSTIWVESAYGGGSTKAGENGGWDLRVNFPEAPPGKVFEVVVEGEGGRKVFTFVNTNGGEEGGGEH